MYGFNPGFNLAGKIFDRQFYDRINDRLKRLRIAIGIAPGLSLFTATLSRDHIGGDRPGTACKAQEGRLRREGGPDLPDSLIDRLQPLWRSLKACQRVIEQFGSETRAFTLLKPEILAHGMGDNKDIRKQDRAIETETANGLERHFCSRCRIIDQFEKPALLCPKRAIFWKIASRLPHQPHGRYCLALTPQGGQQGLRTVVRHTY